MGFVLIQTCVQGTKVRTGEAGKNEVTWKCFQKKAWQHNREDFWMRGGTGLEESRCEAGGPAPALLPWDKQGQRSLAPPREGTSPRRHAPTVPSELGARWAERQGILQTS